MAKSPKNKAHKGPVAVNRKAYRDFELTEKIEAGLQLLGSEVKSLRSASADLTGSYARIDDGQCWLFGANIAPYQQVATSHNPVRKRKLLLHKTQIRKIAVKLEQKGFTLVPLLIYFNEKGLAKIEIALARGKRKYDKRRTITEREQKKDINSKMRKYRT